MVSIARWALGIRACMGPRTCTPSPKQERYLYLTPVPLSALPAPDPTTFTAPDLSIQDSRSLATRVKWDQLMNSLSRDRSNPSRVWSAYMELGSVMGFERMPLKVQQQVLRKSVPRTDSLRLSAARRMQAGNRPNTPHVYESRLQTVIAHIRNAGKTPELEDYNFILEQFAAVGHQTGARLVFQELAHVGVQPSFRTYGLCLQAIAHRLTLPCPFRFQRDMHVEASRMCTELLDDMWRRRIPLTSVNFDLAHRIFKETSDQPTFEKLLKVGYGIDLAYPDRPPLELQGPGVSLLGFKDPATEFNNFKPLPFSTAALNTLIDMLGHTKQISRMVTAYEVLTTPLPTSDTTASAVQWSDEEDDTSFLHFSPTGDTPFHVFPSAVPNTTTFKLLIRYASKARHAVFARHYVVQAMGRDRDADAQLRADLFSKPLKNIISPNFAVNRGTFLPPYGLANRTKHFAFLRWCYAQTVSAWEQKKEDLSFYSDWRQKHIVTSDSDFDAVSGASPALSLSNQTETLDHRTSDPSTQPTPTLASDSPLDLSHSPVMPKLPEVLQIDLDAPPPSPIKRKPLDLDRHISLLTRDVEEMGELVERMRNAVQRLSQRVKERLGRRVWQGKDIFLMSADKRVHLRRKEWTEQVRFLRPTGTLSSSSTSLSYAERLKHRNIELRKPQR